MKRSPRTPFAFRLSKALHLDGDRQFDISRRDFLQNTLKGAAAASLFLKFPRSFASPLFNRTASPKIAIVGGGIAGLNCAYQLSKVGIQADIFEGSSRIGGRIFTRTNELMHGTYTEFGGEFVDSGHADMFSLMQDFQLPYGDVTQDQLYNENYFVNGQFYSEKEIIEQVNRFRFQLLKDRKDCGEDFETEVATTFDQISAEEYIGNLYCDSWMKNLLQFCYTAEYGLETGNQSSLNFISMMDYDLSDGFEMFGVSNERYKIKGGNSTVIQNLFDRVKNQVELDRRLVAIREKQNRYELYFDRKEKPYVADFVVLAVPFTILREVDLDVEMSDEKKNCIDNLGYGNNNKLLMGFSSRPWRLNQTRPSSGSLYNEVIQNGWDSTQFQNGDCGVGGYTAFLGGEASTRIESMGSESEYYVDALEKVFPGSKMAYRKTKTALWTKNPWTKGSYASYRIGQWSTIAGLEAEPIGNILFAGEHCSMDFQGFMNGGAETGRRAAENIITKLGISKLDKVG